MPKKGDKVIVITTVQGDWVFNEMKGKIVSVTGSDVEINVGQPANFRCKVSDLMADGSGGWKVKEQVKT